MMTNVLPKAAHTEDLTVRGLRQSDLPAADSILRSAFDTFTGVTSLFGDRDYVHTRWLADRVGPSPPSATGGWWGRTS